MNAGGNGRTHKLSCFCFLLHSGSAEASERCLRSSSNYSSIFWNHISDSSGTDIIKVSADFVFFDPKSRCLCQFWINGRHFWSILQFICIKKLSTFLQVSLLSNQYFPHDICGLYNLFFFFPGDIGGQMGLFIGASILTILELFDYAYEVSVNLHLCSCRPI